MQTFIIGVTFILGVAVVIAGLFAFFKGLQSGSGSAKILGIEVSGSGGALVLVVGLVMVLSGFGWASSQKETAQANQDKIVCVKDKNEVVAEAKQTHERLQQEVQLRQKLLEQIPAATKSQIEVQNPNLTKVNPVTLSPKLAMELNRVMVHP
jgi:hypothetical protein